jgi:apolipoprotein N-acyltransferase
MATQTLASDQPKAEGPASSTDRGLPHPALLGLVSGLLLWLSFPPAEWSGAAWVALVPLLLLVGSERSTRAVYFGSWVGGFAFWLLAIHWIWWTDDSAWLGWVVMAGFLSSWWPAFLFLARFAKRRLNLPLIVVAPVLWVALEYIRAFILTGFPWYYLAHSQYRLIYFTQIADFSGALGLSFLMVVVNAFWVDLLTLPLFRRKPGGSLWARLTAPQRLRIVVVSLGVIGTLAYGLFRVTTAEFRAGPRVALLQSSEIIRYNSETARSPAQVLAEMESLIGSAVAGNPRPDLIVWPESAFPGGYTTFEVGIDPNLLDKQVKEFDPRSIAADWTRDQKRVDSYFEGLIRITQVPMMVGSTIYEFKKSEYSKFNAAILFRPGLPIQSYHKLHLVPFGEYVPLLKALPWIIRLTPYRGTKLRFLDHGSKPAWFELGEYRLATAICFEDTVPHLVRRFFAEAPDGRQPDLLVNLSNDGWFHATAEHEMHLAVSVFRCIENRVPLARAVNTGISAMIDGNGQIVQSLAKLKTGVLTAVTPLDDRVSFYSQWGDWLGQFCLAALIGLLVLGTLAPRRPHTDPFLQPA